jgi:hypothetical protein
MYTGPKLINDNLVFGYDTGYGVADNSTATRFYPGETTENLIYDMGGTVTSAYPQVVYRSTATETNEADTSAPGGKYSRFTGIDDSSNNQLYSQFNSYSIDVRGDSVNYSVYLKGSGTCHLTIYDNQSGYGTSPTITLTSDWVRYNYTRTVNASATAYWVAVRGVLDTTDVYIAGQQATRGTHATPYVENNRSSTQSLIDLKRTTDIDVSNVSFDSTGQPDFDGTDDHIVASPSNISLGTSLTMEVWIYPTGYNHSRMYLMDPRGDGNTSGTNAYFLFDYHASPDTVHVVAGNSNIEVQSSNFSMPLNNWHNIVATRNGNSWVMYHNGVSVGTGTTNTTSLTLNNDFRIGTYASGTSGQYFFEGLMAVAKFYNTGLSATEVKQNYNAYKNRFGI